MFRVFLGIQDSRMSCTALRLGQGKVSRAFSSPLYFPWARRSARQSIPLNCRVNNSEHPVPRAGSHWHGVSLLQIPGKSPFRLAQKVAQAGRFFTLMIYDSGRFLLITDWSRIVTNRYSYIPVGDTKFLSIIRDYGKWILKPEPKFKPV